MKQLVTTITLLLILFSCKEIEHKNDNDYAMADSTRIEQYFEKTNSIQYINGYDYYTKTVTDNEKIRDTSLILHFLPRYFDSITKITGFHYQPADLVNYLHTIDINNDGELDVIYEGPSGGEPTLTEMYLQDSLSFKKIFTGYQTITEMNFKDKKLASFILINTGCCADPQIVEYSYSVSFDSTTKISLDKTIGYLSQTEQVKNLLKKTQALVTKNKAKLRSEALVFESIEHPVWGSNGNIIGLYPKGSKRTILGNKQDSTGTWLYVLMDAAFKPEKCEFPTFLEQPTCIYGWMKEEDIDRQ